MLELAPKNLEGLKRVSGLEWELERAPARELVAWIRKVEDD